MTHHPAMDYVYHRVTRPFRVRRMRAFCREFGVTRDTRILDVGGTTHNWAHVDELPRMTLANITHVPPAERDPRFEWVIADGRALPFADNEFDIVFCNSVIEHLPGWSDQERLASECVRVGKAMFVETP